jgi:hypothetical protein
VHFRINICKSLTRKISFALNNISVHLALITTMPYVDFEMIEIKNNKMEEYRI